MTLMSLLPSKLEDAVLIAIGIWVYDRIECQPGEEAYDDWSSSARGRLATRT